MDSARKMAEEALATVALRYPNGLGSYDTLSVCTDALRALLASEPAKAPFVSRNEEWGLRPDFTTAGVTAPPAGAEVREAETPGTTRVEGHDEQATDTGRTEDEAKQRNVAGDEAPGQIPELLGVQPTDGAQADPSTGGVPDAVPVLRGGTTDEPVAPAQPADARRRAEECVRYLLATLDRWDAPYRPRMLNVDADDLRALLAAGPEEKAPGHDRIAELESLLRECNAVCLCGCPDSEHDSYGEDGESCGHDDHECIRVAPAVLDYVNRLRSRPLPAEGEAPAPTPVIKESLKTDVIEAAEERGREEVWGDVLDSLRAVYGKDMPYDESPCELIVDLVPPASLPPDVEAAAEALHPYADWHEDDGPVLWYAVPVEEPPYCGEPLCSDWPNEWNAPYDTVTGAFIDGPYAGKILKWQRLPVLPPDAALSSARGARGGE